MSRLSRFIVLLLALLPFLPARHTNLTAAYDPLSVSGEWLINIYKRFISPLQGGNICNFSPTCSQFARNAIRSCGFVPGVVMGADRLTRCNLFAWTYLGRYYSGIEHDRLSDPVDQHIAWHTPPLFSSRTSPPLSSQLTSRQLAVLINTAAEQPSTAAVDAAPQESCNPTTKNQHPFSFPRQLYESGAYREAALEFLRIRFTSPSQPLRAYAALMAGEAYLSAAEPENAHRAFAAATSVTRSTDASGINTMSAAAELASYGIARCLFVRNRYADVRRVLDSAAPVRVGRPARLLYVWSLYRDGYYKQAASIAASLNDDSLGRQLGRLDGTGLPYRSRLTATLLSAALPGAGQLYSGRLGDGCYAFVTVVGLGLVTGYFAMNPALDRDHVKLGIFGTLTTLFYFGNVYGANIAARDYNLSQERQLVHRVDQLLGEVDYVPDYSALLSSPSEDTLQPGRH